MKTINKKGFTVVEVIVSMLITSIIMVFAMSFFFMGEKMFNNSIKGNTSKMIGDNVLDFLSERLKYASEIEVVNNGIVANATYDNALWVTDDMLGYKTAESTNDNVYGEDYYNNKKIQTVIKVLSDNYLSVKVVVLDDADEVYSTENVIKPLNLELNSSSVVVSGSSINTDIINPVISFESAEVVSNGGEETPPAIDPNDVVNWDESLFTLHGHKYHIKFDTSKYYYYNGKYYVSSTTRNFNVDSNTVAPTDPAFYPYVTEYVPE